MRSSSYLPLALLCALVAGQVKTIADDCQEALIEKPSPFMGNNGEIFQLSDGSMWEVKYEYEYLYEYYPEVVICPSMGKLIVNGKALNVEAVVTLNTGKSPDSATSAWTLFENSQLEGSISGTIQMGHIFKTTSGNVYEVTGLTLQLVLELQPDVMVLRKGNAYKLVVDGFDEPLLCKCHTCSGVAVDAREAQELPSSAIRAAQQALRLLGYEPGPQNGMLGPQTS